MNGFHKLKLSADKLSQLNQRLEALNKASGIEIKFKEFNKKKEPVFAAKQIHLKAGQIGLLAFEVRERAKKALDDVFDFKYHIKAMPYTYGYNEDIDKEWVEAQINKYGIKTMNELANILNVTVAMLYTPRDGVYSKTIKTMLTLLFNGLEAKKQLQNSIEHFKMMNKNN